MKILLVGCGKMGSALLNGWKAYSDLEISILDPSLPNAYKNPNEMENKLFDIMVLAVKPQILNDVCEQLKTSHIRSSLIISIAAGKTLKNLENIFSSQQAIIRTMPNLPATIGQGMTVGIKNRNVNSDQKVKAQSLLEVLGKFEWIEDENLMDTVTAVSGSGPAYVFLLIEELAKAGIFHGLPADLATKLARQTVIGSSELIANQPDLSAETLRQNVTSPGGTTEAALNILMSENGLGRLMDQAIEAATKRSRELS